MEFLMQCEPRMNAKRLVQIEFVKKITVNYLEYIENRLENDRMNFFGI